VALAQQESGCAGKPGRYGSEILSVGVAVKTRPETLASEEPFKQLTGFPGELEQTDEYLM
jgi:hypothetical protein